MAIYFDSFNRTDTTSGLGTSDSGHVYSAASGYTRLGITSNAAVQPVATVGAEVFDPGVREFDCTITVGDSGTSTNFAALLFAGDATLQTSLGLYIRNTGVMLLDTAAVLRTGATAVADAGTVRVRATKRDISVWVGTTPQFVFPTTVYGTRTVCAWYFGASSDVTLNGAIMSELSQVAAPESTLITDIREIIDQPDSANSDFTDAQLLRYINQELAWLGSKVNILRRSQIFTGPGDANDEFPMPTDVGSIISVERNGIPLDRLGFEQRLDTTYPDTLRNYRLWGRSGYWISGGRIGFNPALASSSETATLYYAPLLTALVDTTDVPEFPAYFEDAVRYGVAKRCYQKLSDFQSADRYDNERMKAFFDARTTYNQLQSVGHIQIIQ